jgi:4-hydroxythreonine-4-phosphate dehydrogenase
MCCSEKRPLLAVTMGDAAGIGPEIIVRAWSDRRVHRCSRPVVLGHPEVLRRAIRLVGTDCQLHVVDDDMDDGALAQIKPSANSIFCLQVMGDEILDVPHGTIDARTGHAAYQAIVRAARGAIEGQFDGLVTAPIHKGALHAAGHDYPGHTELLAECCGVNDFAMMLYLPPGASPFGPSDSGPPSPAPSLGEALSDYRLGSHGLGVIHVTLHMTMRAVFSQLTTDTLLSKCHLADKSMRNGFGLAAPRIGVCALNPHAGEEGLFGDEELRIIAPAVKRARAEGLHVTGPEPADTLMVRAASGQFDAVVAMYHDQGHIALKLLGMHRAVNVTLGLPIVRTSVAHGTAFDRAWQGTAIANSMVAALTTAAHLATQKGK